MKHILSHNAGLLTCCYQYKIKTFLKSNMAIYVKFPSFNPVNLLLESKDNIRYLDKYLHINKFSAGLLRKTN